MYKKLTIKVPKETSELTESTSADDKPITERIKTFEDAVKELGNEHPLVTEYKLIAGAFDITNDLLAYLELRIICKALNEGWRPTFTEDECRYYPWFRINTPEEYKELSTSEKKECCVFFQSGNNECSGSIVYVNSYYAGSVSSGYNGGSNWLALKTKELAEYCGKQFIDIWISYLFDSNI